MPQFVLDCAKLDEAINKTGFPTEYNVQQKLIAHGWKVISNRYYIDDQKKIEREIDLLATKNGINLIISCKKSDTEFWTFMTSRNTDVAVPFEYNDGIVQYFCIEERDVFQRIAARYPGLASLLQANDSVRAFQQITKDKYTANNDKHIYDSIITTIKAAEYEGTSTINFMLSIFEGELVQKNFDDGQSRTIDEIKYINRHCIGDNDKYYCVHFIKYDALESVIDVYDQAVEELPRFINDLHQEFITDIFDHPSRIAAFQRAFEDDFFDSLYEEVERGNDYFHDLATNPTGIRLYMSRSGKLHLAFNLFLFSHRATMASRINEDDTCRSLMSKSLKKFFGYEGPFVIENDKEAEEIADRG